MSVLESEFMERLRSGAFDEAEATLERWAKSRDMPPARHSFWSAQVSWRRGNRAEALAKLSRAIAGGQDYNCLCLCSRAQWLFDGGSYRAALVDFDAILADTSPTVVEVLTLTASYHAAFCLAHLGDPAFDAAILRCDPAYAEWKDGRERTLDDIRSIYATALSARQPRLT